MHLGQLTVLACASSLGLSMGCASQKVFAPPPGDQPHAKMTVKFLNVRHEPNAAWGNKAFRPKLEICDGGKPGCGIRWCYECEGNGSERQWDISETSVGVELHVPTHEITIVPYTSEKGDKCLADPLVIAPKEGVDYELVYSHVWSGSGAKKSYRCAATVERKDASTKADKPDTATSQAPAEDSPADPDGSPPAETPAP